MVNTKWKAKSDLEGDEHEWPVDGWHSVALHEEYSLGSLCGRWRDKKGSSYQVLVDQEDTVEIRTTRPRGQVIVTRGLVHWDSGGEWIVWGRAGARSQYWLSELDSKSLLWEREGSAAFSWERTGWPGTEEGTAQEEDDEERQGEQEEEQEPKEEADIGADRSRKDAGKIPVSAGGHARRDGRRKAKSAIKVPMPLKQAEEELKKLLGVPARPKSAEKAKPAAAGASPGPLPTGGHKAHVGQPMLQPFVGGGILPQGILPQGILPQVEPPGYASTSMAWPLDPRHVQAQLEYYFSDANLAQDDYLKSVMTPHEGWVSLLLLQTFPRMHALGSDLWALRQATFCSTELELDGTGMFMRLTNVERRTKFAPTSSTQRPDQNPYQ